MALKAFDTAIEETSEALVGPWRRPHQMLNAQVYDSHASIHDDATAQKLGFRGGTIEGPTHFSQFAPLGERLWGQSWFAGGCISAHYRNAVFEGEEVQAILRKPEPGQSQAQIQMVKRDGTEVLRGTASIGSSGLKTALEQRLAELTPLADPVILRDITVGMKTKRQTVRMAFDQNMGELYPFSLGDKLKVITEPSSYYRREEESGNPWGHPIIPIEMLSVLFQYRSRDDRLPIKGPAVGLFADQEIRLQRGLRPVHPAVDAGPRERRLPASQDKVSPESTMSSTMSTCRPVMSVSRSFRIRTTPEDLVPEPYEEIAIQSIWTGRCMARDRSAMTMTAPFSTPTSSRSRPA